MNIIILIITCIALIILNFTLRNFKWIVKEIRNICKDETGYIKLIQLLFVLMIFGSFITLLIYNFFHRDITSKLDIFLTVIVGLMGTVIGT